MGKRDILFLALIVCGIAAMGSSLAPPRTRPTPIPARAELRDVVDRLDRSFDRQWTEQGLKPAPPAPDLAVLRRVSLALTGSIPSLEEVRAFEAMPKDGRIAARVDALLLDRRSADYLAERLTRAFVGTEDGPFLIYRRSRFASWLSDELLKNRPYDAIVRELIAGRGLSTDHPATNFVTVTRDEATKLPDRERLAARVSRAFLGVRIDCAQCHDHPFQPWKRADFRGIAAYFARVESGLGGLTDTKEGEFLVDDHKDGKKVAIEPKVPFRPELDPKTGTRRERLARWVTDPRNVDFSRTAANRAWALMFGRPMVEPIDDLPNEVPEALSILADDFKDHGHDLDRLIRVIASTRAFTIDSTTDGESEPGSMETAWAAFPMTRLRPEQVAGALLQASSPSTIDRESHILIRIVTQAGVNDFVRRHGDPGEDEFNLEPSSTIPQRLLMMNGELVSKKTNGELGNAATRFAMLAPTDRLAIDAAYLATLTRRPTAEEAAHFEGRLLGTKDKERLARMNDLVWTLLNATEFSWDH